MHDAYKPIIILDKLPLIIESLTSFETPQSDIQLLVGTKDGHLLMYNILPSQGQGDQRCQVELLRSHKNFCKKPITQLAVIPEYQILISLGDSVISVHDMTECTFPLVMTLEKTRGASTFTYDVQKQRSLTGEMSVALRLCVSVRKKLSFYYWKSRQFSKLCDDLSLPDVPRSLAWCKESICVGLKSEYFFIDFDGVQLELFPIDKQPEPRIVRIADDIVALGREKQTIFFNSSGKPTYKNAVIWSEQPVIVDYDNPYLIGVLSNAVEIRSIEPRLMIQKIEMEKLKLNLVSVCCRGVVFVASTNNVWCLQGVDLLQQINHLLNDKHFELALKLCSLSELDSTERSRQEHHIKNLLAFDLFCKCQFEESFNMFLNIATDPSHVIGLFPGLLPQDYRNQLEFPDKLPDLQGVQLEKGLLLLIEYLKQVRKQLLLNNDQYLASAIVEGNSTIKCKEGLLQIVDTTLVKCYLQTTDALVAPFLRLPQNYCHLEETERALKRHNKLTELVILYKVKGMHQKALELLYQHHTITESPLQNHMRTVQYLQGLSEEHLDLIFKYSLWILQEFPEDGLKIFIDDTNDIDQLPRQKIYSFLLTNKSDLLIPYLEHVISIWKDDNPLFHNALAHWYLEASIAKPGASKSSSNIEAQSRVTRDSSSDKLIREKLLQFLKTSTQYIPETLLVKFPHDDFYEERAVLLGRLDKHEQTLAIYCYMLNDIDKAVNYCGEVLRAQRPGWQDIYVMLVKLMLYPPDSSKLGLLGLDQLDHHTPDLAAATQLLHTYADHIEPSKILPCLPDSLELAALQTYIQRNMDIKVVKRKEVHIMKSLFLTELLQMQEKRIQAQSQKIVITDLNACYACKKRFGNDSAFVRYPTGELLHYSCQAQKTVQVASNRQTIF